MSTSESLSDALEMFDYNYNFYVNRIKLMIPPVSVSTNFETTYW